MNAGTTAERVYDELKQRILAGNHPPGSRLEPVRIADLLITSATPVRDALHRLVGERLIETRAGIGFFLPIVTEGTLRELYTWHEDLIMLALRSSSSPASMTSPMGIPRDLDDARSVFLALMRPSERPELVHQLEAIADRLAPARIVENVILGKVHEELAAIRDTIGQDPINLRRLVRTYHRRRHAASAAIVRQIYDMPHQKD